MGRTTVRAPMPPSRRAKQFAPFDALKGLTEAIARKEKIPTPRRYLTEDAQMEINAKLMALKKGSIVTVVYYCAYEQEYRQLTGPVTKLDAYWGWLQVGELAIDFYEIAELEVLQQEGEVY